VSWYCAVWLTNACFSERYAAASHGSLAAYSGRHSNHVSSPACSSLLRASAMLKHVIAITLTSLRPSVRHTQAPYQNGWIYCHAFFTTRQPIHSSFVYTKIFAKFRRGHPPCGGAKYRWGIKFSTNKSLYLANDTGYSLTLNTSKMAADTAIVTMEGE